MKSQNNLAPLWDETLKIYEVVRRICQENEIRFWALGGTALGAVRHKGFIPWDDDFDVMMPWPDYDKFLRVAQETLPDYLKIVKTSNTPEFDFLYAKVQDTRKDVSDRVAKETGHPQSEGLFIDIFPFGGVPQFPIGSSLSSTLLRIVRTARVEKSHLTYKSKVAGLLGPLFFYYHRDLETVKDFCEFAEKIARRSSFDGSAQVAHFDNHRFIYEFIFMREWFDKTVWMPFDRTEVPMPAEYDKVLTAHFGDYMKLPPESKRHFTHGDRPSQPWKLGPTNKGA